MHPDFEGTIASFPEATRTRAEVLARAREVGWYHSLKLDESFTSEGFFALDEHVPYFPLPDSLEGLHCLEIGTGNGYWSFQMERRGAASVTATDIGNYADTDFSRLHGQPPVCASRLPDGAYGESFRIAATLLQSRVRYRIVSVYDIRPADLGTFDVVFCSSMLMHLFAPQLALQRVSDVCRGALLLTTQTDIGLDGQSVAHFIGDQIPYVHFVVSPTCLINMVRACGFEQVLRGPTFDLPLRDRLRHPDPVLHTSVIALKDASSPPFQLPVARVCSESDRVVQIQPVRGPHRVRPGQPFDLVVSVQNASGTTWRSPDDAPLGLHWEIAAQDRQQTVVASSMEAGVVGTVADYLPSGLSTLALVRATAPLQAGKFLVRFGVTQGAHRFTGAAGEHALDVDPDGPVTAMPAVPQERSALREEGSAVRALRSVRALFRRS